MILGPLLMILVPVLLIVAVLLAVRRLWPSSTGLSSAQTVPQTPLDILNERFARGDIDKQEYEERRRILSDKGDDA